MIDSYEKEIEGRMREMSELERKEVEQQAREHIAAYTRSNPEWEFKPIIIPLERLGLTRQEIDMYINGEWKVEPVDAIVLYTKGNRKDKENKYGKESVHYVNTKRSDVRDVIMGNRYTSIIVDDKEVSQEDIDIVKKYLVGKGE